MFFYALWFEHATNFSFVKSTENKETIVYHYKLPMFLERGAENFVFPLTAIF
jgi:hypothetical protein